MTRRRYDGAGITVPWDSQRCIRSPRCVTGLPTLFDFDARLWVDAAAAPPTEPC